MADRRDFMGYIGTGAIGSIVGYYVGAQKLLGIQPETETPPETESPPETETPPETESPPETETPPETESPPGTTLSVPFTATFEDGLNGWVVNQRFRDGEDRAPSDPNAGEGGYSSKYGGSVRLHLGGGQRTIGVANTVSGLERNVEVSATYTVETSSPQPGIVGIALFEPDGDDMTDNEGYFIAQNTNEVTSGQNTISASLSRDYPDGTELRVVADVWPGEYTAFVQQIEVQ